MIVIRKILSGMHPYRYKYHTLYFIKILDVHNLQKILVFDYNYNYLNFYVGTPADAEPHPLIERLSYDELCEVIKNNSKVKFE